jgi:hypothetical protein
LGANTVKSQKDRTKRRFDSFAPSMRLKIPSHNGLLDSLRSHSTLHAHAHEDERSLKLTCRTGGRWLTPRDIQALHVRHDVGHHVQFASMVMSSVMCECSGSVSAKMAIISSMSMLSASAIMAFAGAACNSRTALGVSDASCGSRFGYFEPVIFTHARFWKSHFVLFLRSWEHPDSHAGALQKGSKTEHLELESRQSGYVG